MHDQLCRSLLRLNQPTASEEAVAWRQPLMAGRAGRLLLAATVEVDPTGGDV